MILPHRPDKKGGMTPRKPYRIVGTAVLLAAVGLAILWIRVVQGGEDPGSTVETFAARRGPLTIRVLEAGALKAKNPEILCSSLQGRASIIWIIPEGTWVKAGDLLIELDVTRLVDHRVDHVIMFKNAEAAWVNAREALIITKSLAQSNVELAQLKYDFAKLDLEKYRGEGGQYATDKAKAEGDVTLYRQEVKKNEDYYAWSKQLADRRYLSQTQLQADALILERSKLSLTVANNSLRLLEEYDSRRQLAQLLSDVNQTAALLERAKAKARANVIQAEALLAAREQEYRHQQNMLDRLDEQIRNGRIYASTDGMVVYATSGGGHFHDDRKPLADGVEVWQRQELIYLPRSTSTVAEVDVHEANLQKVRLGLPAIVTVDAVPGRKLMGTISRIAPLPDPQSMWMNPDLKVYKAEIALDVNDPQLRSGMNCRAEIIVEQYADAVYIPVQAVVRVNGQATVYVLQENGGTESRQVEISLDDNSMARVARGLEEGELVLLAPPQPAGTVEPGVRLASLRKAETGAWAEQIREKLKAADDLTPTVPRPETGGPPQLTTQ